MFRDRDSYKLAPLAGSRQEVAVAGAASIVHEAMMRGYLEMSQINLSICSECQYVEVEAHHTVERLVTGR